jgi:TonB family protein
MLTIAFLASLASAPAIIVPPKPKATLQALVSVEDYPSAARAQHLTGTTRVRLDVAPTGRVAGCSVAASSGTAILDVATCRLLTTRARFTPAIDSTGNPAADSVEAELSWSLRTDWSAHRAVGMIGGDRRVRRPAGAAAADLRVLEQPDRPAAVAAARRDQGRPALDLLRRARRLEA